MSYNVDAFTDGITKLLDKQEAKQHVRLIEQAIDILIDLKFSVAPESEGWDLLDRAAIRLEKQALRIGIDAGLL